MLFRSRLSPPPLAAEAGALVEAGLIPAMVAAQQATLHAQVDQLQRLVVNPLAQEMVRSPSPFSNLCIVGSARSSARRSARPWWPSSRRSRRPRARAVVAVLELVPWWRAMGAAEDAVQQLGLLMELWDVVHRTRGRGGGAGVRALSRLHLEQLCILSSSASCCSRSWAP